MSMESTRVDETDGATLVDGTDGETMVLCIQSYLRSNDVGFAVIFRISFQTIQC